MHIIVEYGGKGIEKEMFPFCFKGLCYYLLQCKFQDWKHAKNGS